MFTITLMHEVQRAINLIAMLLRCVLRGLTHLFMLLPQLNLATNFNFHFAQKSQLRATYIAQII